MVSTLLASFAAAIWVAEVPPSLPKACSQHLLPGQVVHQPRHVFPPLALNKIWSAHRNHHRRIAKLASWRIPGAHLLLQPHSLLLQPHNAIARISLSTCQPRP